MGWRSNRGLVVALVVGVLVTGCTSDGGDAEGGTRDGDGRTTTTEAAEPRTAGIELGPLAVSTGGRPRIVDADGRTVLLRGANLNQLGDYYQDDPDLPPVEPPTDADWDAMAANGFSVVRLLVHWSRLEPERGTVDEAYLAEIRDAVEAAGERGMYTVIDFHQDAWGKAIATPEGTTCGPGTEPAIGWDGAPEWATITDGADTCRPEGYREGAPAVQAAFRNFYRNTDGIRDAYVATVGAVAEAFADEPLVAGYDLFNEPNFVLPAEESSARYTELVNDLIGAIRSAEGDADGFAHLVFMEPIVVFPLGGTLPTDDLVDDPGIVFAPHNYAEVITDFLTVEQTFGISASTAEGEGWPLWIGEYGIFSHDPEDLDVLTRFAAAEDSHLAAGSAEWQWRQRCGDPHSVGTPGNRAEGTQVHLNQTECPADTDAGPSEDLLRIVGRAFPHRAPGELTGLRSDPATGELEVTGEPGADRDADLVVWVPGEERLDVQTTGLTEPTWSRVEGGWYVTATPTAAAYRLALRPT